MFEEMFGRQDVQQASRSQAWSAAWLRYQRSIGISDPRKVFHSFRHTFKTACRSARIQEEVHDAITGHKPSFSARGYGGPVPLNVKYEAIQNIEFPCLDLSHLYDKDKLSTKKVIDEWTPQRQRRRAESG